MDLALLNFLRRRSFVSTSICSQVSIIAATTGVVKVCRGSSSILAVMNDAESGRMRLLVGGRNGGARWTLVDRVKLILRFASALALLRWLSMIVAFRIQEELPWRLNKFLRDAIHDCHCRVVSF